MSLSPSLAWGLAALLLFGVASFESHAQPAGTPGASQPQGRSWASLSPAQQQALAPLQREWNSIDALRKTKWIEVADRLPALSPEERSRIQTRMAEWARLSPAERGQARLNFKAAQTLPAEDRKARWEAYQALSAEEQRQLAARRAAAAASAPVREPGVRREGSQTKSNLVPNPAFAHAAPPKVVAPSVAPAKLGATTNLVTKAPSPPPHQQPGLPKVPAGSTFVDRNTLLPKRGAQAAATRSAASAASAPVIARP